MRKITITAIAVCCAGVLFGGIGTGIAVAEYSSLEYTGRHILGEENMRQENIDVAVVPVEGKKILLQGYDIDREFHYEETIPEDTVRLSVTYNPDLVRFRTEYEAYDEEPEEEQFDDGPGGEEASDAEPNPYQGIISFYPYGAGSEFDLFMQHKDMILNDLKQGKIGSYEVRRVKEVKVWLNPQMKGYVEYR